LAIADDAFDLALQQLFRVGVKDEFAAVASHGVAAFPIVADLQKHLLPGIDPVSAEPLEVEKPSKMLYTMLTAE